MRRFIRTSAKWTRESVEADRDRIYIFGDNMKGYGNAGQACIRGLPNAYGIPTKVLPNMRYDAFFRDSQFETNKAVIEHALSLIPDGSTVVWHAAIGCGLADLPNKAPKTYKYLLDRLNELTQE